MRYNDFERLISQKIINVSYRNLVRILIDAVILTFSYFFAFDIRFDFSIGEEYYVLMKESVILVVPITIVSLIAFRNYQKFWRFFCGKDTFSLVLAFLVSSGFLLLFSGFTSKSPIPRSVIVIYSIIGFLLLIGVRSIYKYMIASFNWRSLIHKGERQNLLIVGAGNAGELLARQILNKKISNYRPLGFIDDASDKQHIKIHGIQVLGKLKDLREIANKYNIEEIIICIPSASPKLMREIVNACQDTKAKYKTLPSIRDLQKTAPLAPQIRDVSIEDLLDRDPVESKLDELSFILNDKVILVTGAAGSIGSEICRQILRFKPQKLICLDRHENGLFLLGNELKNQCVIGLCEIIIGDIKDKNKLEHIFKIHRPDLVFHAAAYKHVPLMEMHPEEAILNNVIGTFNVAEVSENYDVEKFILISTDKAVNPTSLMGASKRLAEILLLSYAKQMKSTKFINVRFGNVLGSFGSVLPLFKKQIEEGGPITITDPDMQRFFMTIPEAVRLILEAAKMGQCGETFILNMGEPIKIVDFAKQLIRLSGLVPDEDIAITYTGIRPGEKLFEELWNENEKPIKTDHPKINMTKSNGQIAWDQMEIHLKELEQFCEQNEVEEIYMKLKNIIPEYEPNSIIELDLQ